MAPLRALASWTGARRRRRTLYALGLPAGSAVLEVDVRAGDRGTGVGALRARTRRARVPFTTVRAVAPGCRSPGELAAVSGRWGAPTEGPIVWAEATALAVRPRSLDGVAWEVGPDASAEPAPVIDEMARALRPGGRVALLVLPGPGQRRAEVWRELLRCHGFATVGHRSLGSGAELVTATRRGRA